MTAASLPQQADFHNRRRRFIGGSDVAAILGVEGAYKTAFQIWAEKTGQVEPEDLSKVPRIRFGLAAEPELAAWYEDETSRLVRLHDPEWVLHPSLPAFGCHPDGIAFDSRGRRRLLEFKTTDGRLKREWEDGTPLIYQCQVQHNLDVCMAAGAIDEPVADVVCLFGGNEPEVFEVPLDPDFTSAWRLRGEEWWNLHVIRGVPVPVGFGDKETLKRLFPRATLPAVELPGDFEDLDRELVDLKASLARLEKRKEELENVLKAALGEHEAGLLPNGVRYTLKEVARKEYTVAATTYRQLRRSGAK